MTILEEREQIRQAVNSLEICWRCQRVTKCVEYLLGDQVETWLCLYCAMAAISEER